MILLPKKLCDGSIVEKTYSLLFHTTRKENVASILANGLKRQNSAMVFLSTEASSWRHRGAEGDGEVTLAVNIDGLEGKFTDFLPDLDEVNYWGDIPASRICIIADYEKGQRAMSGMAKAQDARKGGKHEAMLAHECPFLTAGGNCTSSKSGKVRCPHCFLNRVRCKGNPKRLQGIQQGL